MRVPVFLLIVFLIGCQKQPHSNDYIYTLKDDHLSLQKKVDILRKSSSINDDDLLASIAILYAQNKNWNEAKHSISKAIKLNPLNASYHLNLADYNAELHDNDEAYNEAKIAYELGAYNKKLEAFIARMAIETVDTVYGKEFILNYYQSNKSKIDAQLLMASLFLLRQDFEKAEKLASQTLTFDSLNIKALEIVYQSYLGLDSTRLAINYGNRLIGVDSTKALYFSQIAKLYNEEGNLNKAASYFARAYQIKNQPKLLRLGLRNYTKLGLYDSVLYYSDSSFAGINYLDSEVLLKRARAFDRKYKYEESYVVYNRLIKMDSTDSVVNAEQQIVQRKIAYLQRKKREQKQLADSVANAMPIINF